MHSASSGGDLCAGSKGQDNHTVLYEANHVCLSELVRGASRQIESKLDTEQLQDLRSLKKFKSKSKSRDGVSAC